ncbi:MAG TPA: hypothetical protein VNA57_02080 [Acidimicrobiales bacterium]|nr:hypothetical protein [Acidimicrobiales bacterium]
MSTPGDVVWEDPPARGPHFPKWFDLLSPLLAHPGRWALVATKPSAKAAYATKGNLTAFKVRVPPGQWEFAARKRGEGEFGVYARYIGPAEAAS